MCLDQPSPTPLSTTELNPEFWEQRYQEGTPRWDLGQPAPPFVSLLKDPGAPAAGQTAVLGAGRGHDALWFAEHGFEVVGFDFAPSAIATATTTAQQRGLPAKFLQRNIFELSPEFDQAFDYVVEHTCFCAIAPDQRPDYVQTVRKLLKPQGELIAIFWAHDRPNGPPFGATLAEIRQLFAPEFDVSALTPISNSPPNRENEEYLARFPVKLK